MEEYIIDNMINLHNKILQPLYYNGYISIDERAEIREYIKELNNKVELQANALKEKDEMLNNRNGVIEHLNLQNNDLQQRIDKAIWLLDLFISDTNLLRNDILKILMDVKKKLKGKDVK